MTANLQLAILQAAINEKVYMVRFSSSTKGKKYFVYRPTAQRTEDKNELWNFIKNDSEVYGRLIADTGLVESNVRSWVLKLLPHVPSVEEDATLAEDAVTADESKSGTRFSKEKDMKKNKVRVENFGRNEKVEDCKTFLTEFYEIISVERVVGKENSHGSYDVTFKDEECARKFLEIKKIKYKERTLRRRLLFSCSHCSKSYFSFVRLYSHVTKDHDGDHFECSDCGKVFSKKKDMEAHKLQKHQDSEFICVTCKKKFKFEFGLLSHLKFGEYCSHQCPWCLKTFTRKNKLEKHKNVCQSVGQPGGSCSICSKSFELQNDLELHRKEITDIDGSYKFACGYCERIFCNISARVDHFLDEHKVGQGIKNVKKCVILFPCEICGLNLQSKKDLLNHLETHKDRKSRKPHCNLCHSEFTLKKNLDRHMMDVYDEHCSPKYRCEECNIVFCSGKQMQKHHKQRHSGHVCTTCDQWFTTKRALGYHLKRQKMFSCSVCGKQFCNKKTFTTHTKSH